MELSFRPARIASVVCRPEEDGAFLFDPETGRVSYINRTAVEVFRLIDGERDVAAILTVFDRRYPEIETEQLQVDVTDILGSFAENQFIASR